MISQSKQEVRNSGIFIGVVKDNKDPDRLGRLKVLVPNYNDNTEIGDLQWFNYVMPYGGYKDEGFFFIPSVGAEVVVMFPNGGETPIWIGCINKKVDNPGPRESTQEADDEHYYHRKQLKTRRGWLMFDDKDEYVTLNHACGSFIVLDKDGDITIRAERNINLKAGKNINITAENGSFSVEADKSAKLETHEGEFVISSDKGKLLLTTLSERLHIISKEKIELIADDDIKVYSDKNVYATSATKNIYFRAKKNIESYATEQYKTHSDKESFFDSNKDMALSTSKNFYRYVTDSFYATTGKTGNISFGKSTDLTVSAGEFNIASLGGELKINAKKDATIHSDKKVAVQASDDLLINSQKAIRTQSMNNTDMYAQKGMNIRTLNNIQLNAFKDVVASANVGVYISGSMVTDMYSAQLINIHTPVRLLERSLDHEIVSIAQRDITQSRLIKSSANIDIASGLHLVRAARIFLN